MAILHFLTLKLHLNTFLSSFFFSLFGFAYCNRVLLESPGQSQIHGLPASASAVLGYWVFTTMSSTISLFPFTKKSIDQLMSNSSLSQLTNKNKRLSSDNTPNIFQRLFFFFLIAILFSQTLCSFLTLLSTFWQGVRVCVMLVYIPYLQFSLICFLSPLPNLLGTYFCLFI